MSTNLEAARDSARDLVTLAEAAHRFYEACSPDASEESEHLFVTILMIEERAAHLKEMLYEATDPAVAALSSSKAVRLSGADPIKKRSKA